MDQICNKCGKKLDEWDMQGNFRFYGQLGYGTKYDGCTLELDLCCECMDALIDNCLISPVFNEHFRKEW